MRRSCETAATRSRLGELGELVVPFRAHVDVAAPGADRLEPVAHGLDVAHDPAGHELRRPHGDRGHEQREHGHHRGVVVGDEHEHRRRARRDQHLPGGHRHRERELSPQPAQPPPVRRDDVRGRQRPGKEQGGEDARPRPVAEPDRHAAHDRGDDHEDGRRPHGEKRYPTPHTVWIHRGSPSPSAGSIFERSRRMWTVTVEVSE